jgi:V8-like Glu-specific endopeptidase
MKKLFLFVFAIATGNCIFAQISEGGMPKSFLSATLKSKSEIASYNLPSLDTAVLMQYNNEKSTPFRYGVVKNVTIDLKSVATKTAMPDGGTLWRYKIASGKDKSIELFFSSFVVPDGAQLYLYNEDYSEVRGAYTNINMRDDFGFVIGDFTGNYVIVEYYEPVNPKFEGSLVINGIGEAYIDIISAKSRNIDADGFIGVNCDEGKEWQEQKHSVIRFTFSDGASSYLCSGALINNTKNDGTAYFLTANHCISSPTVAPTVVAYFNYENPACTDVASYFSQTVSGATLMTTGASSDYTLLLFNNTIPTNYKPYYAGWDVNALPATNTAGIHHPHGYKKKISIDNDPAVSYEKTLTWDDNKTTPAGTHWQVSFDEGETASGSSGSPLFNQDHRIVGQLHGGDAVHEYYGKLSYSYYNPGTGFSSMMSFLDPSSTGATTLNGYYPLTNYPDPQFLCDFSNVCVSSAIKISGFSAFSPTSWKWSFSPSTISYANNTDASSQNPEVSFDSPGLYTASLIAQNVAGTETLQLADFISAGLSISLQAFPSGHVDSCAISFSKVNLEAYGADAYLWTLSTDAANYFTIENNTTNPVVIKLKDGIVLTSSVDLALTLQGTQGSCQSTINYSLPITYQSNDNISNAIRLYTGKSSLFSNKCATTETGEPSPPATLCTGQMSWCDETGSGEVSLDNTVWFYYIPDYSQTASIYSKGMDNQIAVYKADTYNDVLNGNAVLIGANDDYSSTNVQPKLTNLNLLANKTYWIQVDGSAGGAIGDFYMYIAITSGINDLPEIDEEIKVYPVPACDYVDIASDAFTGASEVTIEVYNSAGAKIYTENDTNGQNVIRVPLGKMPSGIYFARITCDGKRSNVKIIK